MSSPCVIMTVRLLYHYITVYLGAGPDESPLASLHRPHNVASGFVLPLCYSTHRACSRLSRARLPSGTRATAPVAVALIWNTRPIT
jgi:hypothetical protein